MFMYGTDNGRSLMKTFIIEEKFTGYANIRIEAETEEEALSTLQSWTLQR